MAIANRRARLCIAATLGLGVAALGFPGTTSTSASAQDPLATPTASETAPALSAASTAATAAARTSGMRVEDLSQRTETTRVYANPDGTWTNETSSGPESILDGNGNWEDIDTRLVERNGALVPRAAPTDLKLSDGGDRVFASMSHGSQDFGWHWDAPLPQPVVDGATATYPDVIDGGDLVVTATPTGFTHSIVLRERLVVPVQISIPISADGGDLVQGAQGDLKITNPDGEGATLRAPAPEMWDSSGPEAGVLTDSATPVATDVAETAAGTPVLNLKPDNNFLSDPETVYPVTVDPSFSFATNNDTWVSNEATASHLSSTELRAGTNGTATYRSYIRFGGLAQAIPVNASVQSASLVLRNFESLSCSAKAINVSRIVEDWNVNSITWSNAPAGTGAGNATYSTAKGYDASCPAGDAAWNVTDIVNAWNDYYRIHTNDGTTINYGLRVRAADESIAGSYRRYRSLEYTDVSRAPHINVSYTIPTSAPQNAQITPSVTDANGIRYVDSLTPTASALMTDPFGIQHLNVSLRRHGSGTEIWSGSSLDVNPNSLATVVLPAGLLSDYESYDAVLTTVGSADARPSSPVTVEFTVSLSFDVSEPAPSQDPTTTDNPADDGADTSCLNLPSDSPGFCLPVSYETFDETDPLDTQDLTVAAVGQALERGEFQAAEDFVEGRAQSSTDATQATIEALVSNGLPADHATSPTLHPSSLTTSALPRASTNPFQDTVYYHEKWKTVEEGHCSCDQKLVQDVKVRLFLQLPMFSSDPVDLLSGNVEWDVIKGGPVYASQGRCRTRYERSVMTDVTKLTWSECDTLGSLGYPSVHELTPWMTKHLAGTRGGHYHQDVRVVLNPAGSLPAKTSDFRGHTWTYPSSGGAPSF